VKLNKLDLTGCHVSVDSKGRVNPHFTADTKKFMFHTVCEVNSLRSQTK